MANRKTVHIIGGGTLFHIRPHLALCAPAYGTTAHSLRALLEAYYPEVDVNVHLTRMAGGERNLETNEDVAKLIDCLVEDPTTSIIFMPVAMCDFDVTNIKNLYTEAYAEDNENRNVGKNAPRLSTKTGPKLLRLESADNIIKRVREVRKDIFLVGFKTTTGANQQSQYLAGLNLCKEASCNLVLANDLTTRLNMIVTPEEAAYTVSADRQIVLRELVGMAMARSSLNFTRSTVVPGQPVSWHDELVPQSLRTVVDHCISRGAYQPFRGSTAGHFAVKVNETTFLTSRRKTDYNNIEQPDVGLVKVQTDGDDRVIAFGSKPSVGGQSQRIVFENHPEYDCIVHFHCPLKSNPRDKIEVRSQQMVECGSHECGKNTSDGLKPFGNLLAVMLDNHGPNIVFNRKVNPKEVIDFIEANFDLGQKSGGFNIAEA